MLSYLVLIDSKNPSIVEVVRKISDDFMRKLTTTLDEELVRIESLILTNKLQDAEELMPKEDPNDHRVHFLQGLLAYMKGSLKLSVDLFLIASQGDKNILKAQEYCKKAERLVKLIESATNKMKDNENELAHDLLTKALKIDTNNKRTMQAIYFQRAACQYNMGKIGEAFEDYLKFEALQNETGMIMNGIKFAAPVIA